MCPPFVISFQRSVEITVSCNCVYDVRKLCLKIENFLQFVWRTIIHFARQLISLMGNVKLKVILTKIKSYIYIFEHSFTIII